MILLLAGCKKNNTSDEALAFPAEVKELGADSASYETIDEYYAKDYKNAYYIGKKLRATGQVLPPFEFKTSVIKIDSAVTHKFQVLGFGYANDNRRAYFEGEPFKVKNTTSLRAISKGFCVDNYQVYFNREVVPGGEGKTFHLIDTATQGFAKDTKLAYYFVAYDEPRIDKIYCFVSSFDKIQGPYAKDIKSVYYTNKKVNGADPRVFQVLNNEYGKDKNSVYFNQLKIEGADPVTFEIFSRNSELNEDFYFTKDRSYVFWKM